MEKTSMFQEFEEAFKNPGKEFRGTPFWSWNTKLDADCLEKQIEQFREMGMGGFYMHTRVGLDTEYMGCLLYTSLHALRRRALIQVLF